MTTEPKSIRNLIPDIQDLLKTRGWFDSEQYSPEISRRLEGHFNTIREPRLGISKLGEQCPKALWHSIHTPELAEPLPPGAMFKYAFGHSIEAMAIVCAKAAGHEVTGEQDELILDGIVGHRDCVIDGCTVDVKSSSSIGFSKFKAGTFSDSFGYLDQLDGYVLASHSDPLVTRKDTGYLLVVDKQLGHMYLHEHTVTSERARVLRSRIARYKEIIAQSEPPACECATVDTNYYSNLMLNTRASYNPFKWVCHPTLRCFLYAKGPVFLTKVDKVPWNKNGPIKEVDRYGNTVYS